MWVYVNHYSDVDGRQWLIRGKLRVGAVHVEIERIKVYKSAEVEITNRSFYGLGGPAVPAPAFVGCVGEQFNKSFHFFI